MTILAGGGNDPVGVVGSAASTIKGSFFANPGAGANDLTLPCGLAISGNAVYVGGAGSDNLAVDANIGGNLLALLGAGNDTFTYGSVPGCCPMIAGTAFIDGGLGIDTYNASTTCKVTWPNTILNFP